MKRLQIRAMWARKAARQMPNPRKVPMKRMKIEQCREGVTRRKVKVTCTDCQMLDWDHRSGDLLCYRGRTAKRLCKEFIPRPGVEIVKEKKQ